MAAPIIPSRYNHLTCVKTTTNRNVNIVSNLLYGASAVVDDATFTIFRDAESSGTFNLHLNSPITEQLVRSGYCYRETDAEERLIECLGDSYGSRDEIAAGLGGGQYGFITSLNCNLACPYCFQREKADSVGYLTRRQVDLGLAAIKQCEHAAEDIRGGPTLPKISITGGEPLLPGRRNRDTVDYLVERLCDLGWPFNLTTNGTELAAFVRNHEVSPQCRNIQVTLDGPRDVHDLRRCFRGGQPSFNKIANGVEAALAAGWKVTLRVNLDLSNVRHLSRLASFVRDRGWPEFEMFSSYVSPVTDHGTSCDIGAPNEADLLKALLGVVKEDPDVREVFDIRHFRGFSYVERMLVHGAPRFPVVFRCEAITGMYIFDPSGSIHVCLEAVGEERRRVGSYDPEFRIDADAAAVWSSRNVLDIPECDSCKIRFVCAGGCAKEALNTGSAAGCMPFLDEMDIAWQYFADTQPALLA